MQERINKPGLFACCCLTAFILFGAQLIVAQQRYCIYRNVDPVSTDAESYPTVSDVNNGLYYSTSTTCDPLGGETNVYYVDQFMNVNTYTYHSVLIFNLNQYCESYKTYIDELPKIHPVDAVPISHHEYDYFVNTDFVGHPIMNPANGITTFNVTPGASYSFDINLMHMASIGQEVPKTYTIYQKNSSNAWVLVGTYATTSSPSYDKIFHTMQAPSSGNTTLYFRVKVSPESCIIGSTVSEIYLDYTVNVSCADNRSTADIAVGCTFNAANCTITCPTCDQYYNTGANILTGDPKTNCSCIVTGKKIYVDPVTGNNVCRYTDPTKKYPCNDTRPGVTGDNSPCPFIDYNTDYQFQLERAGNTIVLNNTNATSQEVSYEILPDVKYKLKIIQKKSTVYELSTDQIFTNQGNDVLEVLYGVKSSDGGLNANFVYDRTQKTIKFTSNPNEPLKNIGRLTLEFNGVPAWMNCCGLYKLILTVGGTDKTLPPVDCPVAVPQVLNDIGWGSDIEHMTWTITSSTYITVGPGVTISNGGKLLLNHPAEGNSTATNTTDDPAINWKQLTVFNDYGEPVGQQRTYFDDKGIMTQSQSKSFQQGRGFLWVAQSMEDSYGRPALQTLPAPVANYDETAATGRLVCGVKIDDTEKYIPISFNVQVAENLPFQYETNFIKNVSGNVFSYSDFDGDKVGTPTALTADVSTGKLGWYYSSDNNSSATVAYKEPYTPATSYPYVQTIYENDGTDEVKSVVSPGDVYRTGGTSASHVAVNATNSAIATETYVSNYVAMYAAAFPAKTFDPANNVYKQTNTDADGKVSVVYSDREGKPLVVVQALGTTDEIASYSFYNAKGQLRYSLSPKSAAAFVITNAASNANNFSSLDKTAYTYDFSGNLTGVVDPDRGETKYKYTKDGKLRFSQNAEQKGATHQRFSYTNYDAFDRPVESGEYTCNNCSFTFDNIVYDDIQDNNAFTGYTKADITKTYYDGDSNGSLASFTQNFVNGQVSSSAKYQDVSTLVSQSWYSYDVRGRLKIMKQSIPALSSTPITIEYKYNSFGSVMEVAYQRGLAEQFYHYYDYTNDGKLNTAYISTTAPVYEFQGNDPDGNPYPTYWDDIQLGSIAPTSLATMIKVASYDYYLHGPLKKVDYYKAVAGTSNVIQTQEYIYTSEGWLKAINHPTLRNNLADASGSFANSDRFALTLEYYDNDYTKNSIKSISTGTNYYSGNIRATTWMNKKQGDSQAGYRYSYDNRNQLTATTFGTIDYVNGTFSDVLGGLMGEQFGYDKNGNINFLTRKLNQASSFVYNFTPDKFTYSGNKLTNLAGYGAYTFNDIGQVTAMKLPNTQTASQITYNPYHLTESIIQANGEVTSYEYDERGNRISATDVTGAITRQTFFVYDAMGNLMCIYEKPTAASAIAASQWIIYGASKIGTVSKSGTTYTYDYELTDHLGTVRATVDALQDAQNNTNTNDQGFEYYAFGSLRSSAAIAYRFGYQGQYAQKDEETGLYHFDLRDYDHVLGRWLSTDPYGQYSSPYIGMGNNPIIIVDPDGGQGELGITGKWSTFGGSEMGILNGHLLNEIKVTPTLRELWETSGKASGALNPDYFIESLVVGNAILKGFKAITSTSKINTVYHSTTTEGAATNILRGINPSRFNDASRFGGGLYVSTEISTTLAEISFRGLTRINTISYAISGGRFLNATSPILDIATRLAPKVLRTYAQIMKYDGIIYNSVRASRGTNIAIFKNFGILKNGTKIF